MYVGLVIYGRLDTLSGGYLYDRQLVAHLRAQGDRVDIVSLPWTGYGRHLTHNLSLSLSRRLRHTPWDVLLQDELNHPSLCWLNRWLRPYIPYPIVTIVHHLRSSELRPAWQNRLYRLVEQRYLTTVDGFVYNSQTTRQVVAGLVGEQRPSLVAVPAGDRFLPTLTEADILARAHAPGPLRLLFVGNLIPRKGLHQLLRALIPLPVTAWRLDVVGNTAVSPSYTRSIYRQVQQAGWETAVTLHGPLSDVALAERLAHSHLLVVPSSYEGFGIVYLEGMAFGLPAIAGVGGAAHELVTEGQNGYLVAETAVLTQHLTTLHQDRTRLAHMSLAARQRFLAHPTWAETTTHIRHFLLQMSNSPLPQYNSP